MLVSAVNVEGRVTYLDFLEPVSALSDIIVVLERVVDDDHLTNVAV